MLKKEAAMFAVVGIILSLTKINVSWVEQLTPLKRNFCELQIMYFSLLI